MVKFKCSGLAPSFRRGHSCGLSTGAEQVLYNKWIHLPSPTPLPPNLHPSSLPVPASHQPSPVKGSALNFRASLSRLVPPSSFWICLCACAFISWLCSCAFVCFIQFIVHFLVVDVQGLRRLATVYTTV